jgi:hypothetical protein
MPSIVPWTPSAVRLARLVVGNPVGGRVPLRWIKDLAFLLAYNLPPIASVSGLPDTGITYPGVPLRLAYNRSPGCHVLLVMIEMLPATNNPASFCTMTVTGPTGSVWCPSGLDGTGPEPNGLDGSTDRFQSSISGIRALQRVIGYLDVSAVTPGVTNDISVSWVQTGGAGTTEGIHAVHLIEVPSADVDPTSDPAGEVGASEAWAQAGYPILEGDAAEDIGTQRIVAMMEKARNRVHQHLQLIAHEEHTALAFKTTTANPTYGDLNWRFVGGGVPPYGVPILWKMAARRLYTQATNNVYTLRVRYRSTLAGIAGSLRVTVLDSLGAGPTAATIALPASTAWTTVTTTLNVPCTGSGECTVKIEGWHAANGTGDYVAICQIALIENETA